MRETSFSCYFDSLLAKGYCQWETTSKRFFSLTSFSVAFEVDSHHLRDSQTLLSRLIHLMKTVPVKILWYHLRAHHSSISYLVVILAHRIPQPLFFMDRSFRSLVAIFPYIVPDQPRVHYYSFYTMSLRYSWKQLANHLNFFKTYQNFRIGSNCSPHG